MVDTFFISRNHYLKKYVFANLYFIVSYFQI